MLKKLTKIKDVIYQKYWIDPVWSKVIAVGIVFLFGSIFTPLIIALKSLYDNVSFKSTAKHIVDYFKLSTEVNNMVFWASLLILSCTLFLFFKSFISDIIKKISKNHVKEIKELPKIRERSTVFFSYRLSEAFPGQRGLTWYEPKVAVERLKILLHEPLMFEPERHDAVSDPIWWFRGYSALFIQKFKPLSKTKVLMNIEQLELKRIAVYISDLYYKSFVYVEAKGEAQTGLHKFSQDEINRQIKSVGYSSEEYGTPRKKLINRAQFDDKATVVNGRVVDASDAELRVRYHSLYNFIIAAKESPINSINANSEITEKLDEILKGELEAEVFFEYLDTLNKSSY